ncbi:MAG TPA: hypothetical protein VG733_09790 [Chthoniobacteraceae bacterium]|nr:hypothetical protein [Chthoniobacteraceae bacterium]
MNPHILFSGPRVRARDGTAKATNGTGISAALPGKNQIDAVEEEIDQTHGQMETGVLLESAVRDMNQHILPTGSQNIYRHDGLMIAGILLALAVAALAFWFHPFLTVLSVATSCALIEITKSIVWLCKTHARWSRLVARKNAARALHPRPR